MSVVVETPLGEELLITKGAVEEMLAVTRRIDVDRRLMPLADDLRDRAVAMAQDLNRHGFRVLAVGYRKFGLGKGTYSVADESDLIFAGIVAFLDPPKKSAAPAIRALKEHGVKVKILTGDNEIVTRRICEDVGIEPGRILLGGDIEAMNDTALPEAVETAKVFAKTAPA
jgi:Mg2+-importing ATPase